VIDDSYVWKDRLRRERATVRRKLRQSRVDADCLEQALVAVEVFAFLTGYITRKLFEAKKMSDELESAAMEVVMYPRRNLAYKLDLLNANHLDRAYDFGAPETKTLGVQQLCNMLIHSFVLTPVTDEARRSCEGFLVNSDRTKDEELVFVAWADFDVLVDEVIGDHVVEMRIDRIENQITKSRVPEGYPKPRIALNVARR
jgi:hypothetical protein